MNNLVPLILITLISGTLCMATPLIFASIGGLFSENSGVMNIALEGIMLIGAFGAVVGAYYFKNMFIAILFAAVFGGLVALIHAYVCIKHKANQVVSGAAINILSAGLPSFLLLKLWNSAGRSPIVPKLSNISIPVLKNIPILGDALNQLNILVYLAILLIPISHVVLYKTRLGLRIRAVGEHPKGADTAGIDVYKIRYLCVIISGVLSGIAGAYLSIGEMGMFTNQMSAGRGFIALAAMIFGKWKPIGAFKACLLFGAAESLEMIGQVAGLPIPSDLLAALPYILTIIVLTGFVGRTVAPSAVGKAYPD